MMEFEDFLEIEEIFSKIEALIKAGVHVEKEYEESLKGLKKLSKKYPHIAQYEGTKKFIYNFLYKDYDNYF